MFAQNRLLLLSACVFVVFYDTVLRGNVAFTKHACIAQTLRNGVLPPNVFASSSSVLGQELSTSSSASTLKDGNFFTKNDYYDSIERKFDFLDAWTRRSRENYRDRMWGIASISLYAGVKTRFIFDT